VVGDLALHAADNGSAGGQAPSTRSPAPRWSTRLAHAIRGDVRYYCQKPWTDLHNFTVDGRMDVCCIATGESQARYALGNLMTQSFQDVWNGERAQEFRRTVNSAEPLPPCRRCPMAYAYQGPLFNPAGAERRVRKALAAICAPLPFGQRLYEFSARVVPPAISTALFRGFKR
jgi:radical SAM protein with 4Fe4S-binding SPASM domain